MRFALSKDTYLHKQQNISHAERMKNLKILVQRPEVRSSANLDDLREAHEAQEPPPSSETSTQVETELCLDNWPPEPYEHLALKTDSGWKVAEFVRVEDKDHVVLRLLSQIQVRGYQQVSLWEDSNTEEEVVSNACILPIRPETEVVQSLSILRRHQRKIVIQVGYPEYIESLNTL